MTEVEALRSRAKMQMLTDDRALAIGLIASLVTVCTHNMVDNLYVHSMTILFALLLVALIRLPAVTSQESYNKEKVAY